MMTAPITGLYRNTTVSVTIPIRPSIAAVMRPSAKVLRIGSSEMKRDRMSPMWRFSKYVSGSRTKW